eukprot:6200934-Pleurochrysis_carterae.AAC.1
MGIEKGMFCAKAMAMVYAAPAQGSNSGASPCEGLLARRHHGFCSALGSLPEFRNDLTSICDTNSKDVCGSSYFLLC